MEHLLEYKHFKVWPSKDNVKDPNEPFFNDDKYDYKRRKEIFGAKDLSKHVIEIDADVVEELLMMDGLSDSVIKILNKIKRYAVGYHEYQEMADADYPDSYADYPDSYIVFEDVSDEDVRTLKELGFGIRIYDDSNEYSESFGDKCKIMWEWK